MRPTPTPVDLDRPSDTSTGEMTAHGPPGGLNIVCHGQTDPGRVRPRNEDQFVIASPKHALDIQQGSVGQPEVHCGAAQGHLFLVADGMGGHAGGAQASELAVSTIEEFLLDTVNWCSQLKCDDGDGLLDEFQKGLEKADARLFREARRRPELHGMGTTVTLAFALGRSLFVAHVGDSRCYRLRNHVLYRLTTDHTLVAELVRRGVLKPEEAAAHRFRHVISNVVGGTDKGVKVEVHKAPLEPGDCILLCSDGLTEMVFDAEIQDILVATPDPETACKKLIARANEKGGKDNITVIVARFDE